MTRVTKRIRSRKAAIFGALAAVAAATTMFVMDDSADAIPAGQAVCDLSSLTDAPAPTLGPLALTPARSITLSSPQLVKVDATADIGVDSGAEVRLGWAINGGTPNEGGFGPANFADHQEFFETRSTFALISLPAGTTTIQPWIRVSGSQDKRATMLHRCFSIQITG